MTIEAAPQPSNFTAKFVVKVTGIRTGTLGDKSNVIKQVDWILTGEECNQKFELPQTTQLSDPDINKFIPLVELTENDVISWIETTEERMPSIKAHIQSVLDKEVAKSKLSTEAMPWSPADAVQVAAEKIPTI